MDSKKALDTLKEHLRSRVQREYNSIESLSLEYEQRFPQEKSCNAMLQNLVRLFATGLDTSSQIEYLNKYFDEINNK
jgi:hypothetical protein